MKYLVSIFLLLTMFAPSALFAQQDSLQLLHKQIAQKPDAAAYWQRACYYYQKKDYREAIRDLEKSLIFDPQQAEAYWLRAQAKEMLGDYSGAINDYNQLLHIGQKSSESLLQRGRLRLRVGDRSGACFDWERSKAPEAQALLRQYCQP